MTNNLPIKIYVEKKGNRTILKQKKNKEKPQTKKLLWNTENKITKDENVENVPYSDIEEVVLVHCNIANMESNIEDTSR